MKQNAKSNLFVVCVLSITLISCGGANPNEDPSTSPTSTLSFNEPIQAYPDGFRHQVTRWNLGTQPFASQAFSYPGDINDCVFLSNRGFASVANNGGILGVGYIDRPTLECKGQIVNYQVTEGYVSATAHPLALTVEVHLGPNISGSERELYWYLVPARNLPEEISFIVAFDLKRPDVRIITAVSENRFFIGATISPKIPEIINEDLFSLLAMSPERGQELITAQIEIYADEIFP